MTDILDGRPIAGQSTVELIQRAGEQIGRLVRDEIALARAEIAAKARRAGLGIVLAGAGALLALFGGGALIATLIIVAALFLPLWAAAAAVTGVLLATAGVLVVLGMRLVVKAGPPRPGAALASVRADMDEFRHTLKERSRE